MVFRVRLIPDNHPGTGFKVFPKKVPVAILRHSLSHDHHSLVLSRKNPEFFHEHQRPTANDLRNFELPEDFARFVFERTLLTGYPIIR